MPEKYRFYRREDATLARLEWWPHIESPDLRSRTVTVSDDAPEHVHTDIAYAAAESREAETEQYGQMRLTPGERDRIDLTLPGNNLPKLWAVKAIGVGKGVSNWLDHYDRTLSVDEHREVYERASGDRRGVGRDPESEEELVGKMAQAYKQMQRREQKRQRGRDPHP